MGFSGGASGSGGSSFVPIGAIMIYGGAVASPPSGWVACLGQAISRTTFSALFGIIGTEYGVGDGSTTFNVPDFRTSESFPRGAVNDAARGTTGGRSVFNQSIAEMPAHTHQQQKNSSGSNAHGTPAEAGTATPAAGIEPLTQSTGSGIEMDNKPPFLDCNFIIKV